MWVMGTWVAEENTQSRVEGSLFRWAYELSMIVDHGSTVEVTRKMVILRLHRCKCQSLSVYKIGHWFNWIGLDQTRQCVAICMYSN